MKGSTKKILIFFLLISAGLYGEALLKGDFLTIDHKNQIWILRGNVSLASKKYRLESSEMTYYRSEKRFQAQGNVHIFLTEENRHIYSDSLEKNGSVKTFRGNPVRVSERNGEKETLSQTLEIREEASEKILIFSGNARILEKTSMISAGKITYHDQQKKAILEQQAKIEKPSENLTLEAQSLLYEETSKTSTFQTPVKIFRKEAEIAGDSGSYQESEDRFSLNGKVSYAEKKKNRRIEALKMFSVKENEKKIFVFQDEVSIQDGDFQGTCDQLEYLDEQDIINLKGNARLSDPKKDLEIESGMISIDQKKDQIYLLGSVSIRQKDKVITGGMGIYDRKTSSIMVQGNPSYRKNQDTAKAERIILNTETNEVKMIGNFQGSFKPEEKTSSKGE